MIDTFSSFVAGYAVAAVLVVAYVTTLWVRSRRLRARAEQRAAGLAQIG
jgi:hypothetical protein